MPNAGIVYYYVRGMTNYPLIVGDVQLPNTARLRLYQNILTQVQPHQFLKLVPRQVNSSGMLLQVTLSASSKFIGFMEGCVRAHIDDGNGTGTNESVGTAAKEPFCKLHFLLTPTEHLKGFPCLGAAHSDTTSRVFRIEQSESALGEDPKQPGGNPGSWHVCR
jgi:hypothetical protein